MIYLLAAALVALPQAPQESPWTEVRFHRVHLRNGNFIDGQLIRQTPKEIILNIKTGEISIRQDLVEKVEFIKMRSVTEKPATVERPKEPPPVIERRGTVSTTPATVTDAPTRPTPSRKPEELFQPADATRELVDPLVAEFEKVETEEKPRVAEKLAKLQGEAGAYLASLLEQFRFEDTPLVVEAVIKIKEPRSIPVLIQHLDAPDPSLRAQAAYALGELGADAAIVPLHKRLKDPDPLPRGAAVSALQQLGSRDSFREIEPLLTDDDREVRTRAISAVVSLARKHQLEDDLAALLAALLRTASPEIRVELVHSLGQTGRSNYWSDIAALLEAPQAEVRGAAVSALASLGAKDAGEALARLLESETDRIVQMQLVAAVRELRATQAIDALIRLLDQPSQELKTLALQALTVLTGQNLGTEPQTWRNWRDANR